MSARMNAPTTTTETATPLSSDLLCLRDAYRSRANHAPDGDAGAVYALVAADLTRALALPNTPAQTVTPRSSAAALLARLDAALAAVATLTVNENKVSDIETEGAPVNPEAWADLGDEGRAAAHHAGGVLADLRPLLAALAGPPTAAGSSRSPLDAVS